MINSIDANVAATVKGTQDSHHVLTVTGQVEYVQARAISSSPATGRPICTYAPIGMAMSLARYYPQLHAAAATQLPRLARRYPEVDAMRARLQSRLQSHLQTQLPSVADRASIGKLQRAYVRAHRAQLYLLVVAVIVVMAVLVHRRRRAEKAKA